MREIWWKDNTTILWWTNNKHRQIQQKSNKKWAYKQWQHKINTSVCKLILTVTENHKDSKNTAHHKL